MSRQPLAFRLAHRYFYIIAARVNTLILFVFCNELCYKDILFVLSGVLHTFTFKRGDTMKDKIEAIKRNISLFKGERDTWFTISELCAYLDRSRVTVHRYKKEGLISYRKVGGRYYFNKKEIDRSIVKIE